MSGGKGAAAKITEWHSTTKGSGGGRDPTNHGDTHSGPSALTPRVPFQLPTHVSGLLAGTRPPAWLRKAPGDLGARSRRPYAWTSCGVSAPARH